jgi:nitroreductase
VDIDKAIRERRSIRKFKKRPVSWKKINEILESFIYAPCAGNLQNWRLIILKNDGKLNKACYEQEAIVDCDFLVIICSDDAELKRHYKKKGEIFAIQNTSAGIQNMLLKAYSLKIGSCWIGVYNEEKIKGILKIPDNIKIHAIVAFGYPDEKPDMPLRASLRSIINFKEFGNKNRDIFPLVKK